MRVIVRPLSILSLLLASFVLWANALFLPPAAAPAGAAGGFVLRPGVVVDSNGSVLYMMSPGGGARAVDVLSGRSVWYTEEAAKPLLVSNGLLVALKDAPKSEPGSPASQYLEVMLLRAADGQKQRTVRVPTAGLDWSAIDDGPGISLQMAASAENASVVLSWFVEGNKLTGVAPPRAPTGAGRSAAATAGKTNGGRARINIETGQVETESVDTTTAERLTRLDTARESQSSNLSGAPGVGYLSADGRHVLTSQVVGDDRDLKTKYLWTISSVADGRRIGEVHSPFPRAPFFVSGTKLVFESRPYAIRVNDKIIREPLTLRAVDLAFGAVAWSFPLRDTTFYGPFPESYKEANGKEATAQDVPDPTPARQLVAEAIGGTWQAIGPAPKRSGINQTNPPPPNEVSGAIHTMAPHPTNATILYIGAVNGGIWKTTNATDARPIWTQLTDPQVSLSIGAMDLDPIDTTAQTIVAGIGRFSSFGRRGGPRTGLLRTADGGATWTTLNGGGVLTGKNISGVALRGTRIAVAVNAADTPGVEQLGIFRSTDGGGAFTQISSGNGSATGLPFGMTNDLIRDPANASRLFTGVIRADAFGGLNGVYRSLDGGGSWTKVSNSAMDALIVTATTNNIEFAVGPNNNVYALIVNAGRLAGLFRSTDAGTSWTSMDVPNAHPLGQGSLHLSEAVDPTNTSIVYVGGDTAIFRCNAAQPLGSQCVTLQGSGTLNNTSPHSDSREMMFDAAGRLLLVNDGGIFLRTSPRNNQGDWFSMSNNIQAFEEHSMAYDPNANVAMGGFQDNGAARELGPNRIEWVTVNGGDGGDVAIDATSSPGLSSRYSSSQNLGGFRRQVFDVNNVLQSQVFPALTLVGGGVAPTFQFVTPIRLNNVDARRLLIGGSNSLYESFDQGETIRQVLPATPVNGSGHPLAYGGAGNPDIVYIGSADTVRTRTGAPPAELVQSTSYPGTGTGRAVIDMSIDPTDPNTVFVIDTTTVYLTENAGGSWTDITGNLLSLAPGALRSVAHIRNASGEAVAVGANSGVFVALANSGFRSWSLLGSGFPKALAYDLEYVRTRDLLVAGTLGRGTWLLPQPSFTTTIFSSTFDAGEDGFTFVKDAFGTNQPNYVSGGFVNPGGFAGGGLRVLVGGIDDATILNMSGGWRRSFNLSTSQLITLSFDFNMTQNPDYENDEFSDMLFQIDGQPAAIQAHIVGDGNGGTPRSTGPVSRALDLGCLPPGLHTVTLGVRNNKKTLNNESTTLLLDNVSVRSSGACP